MNGSLHNAAAVPAPDRPVVAENVAGNARLTALTGLTLLVLFAAEVVTVILGVDQVLTAHAAIGFALAPAVLLKIGSTGWRALQYYRGNPAYVRHGAPPTALRVLGPVLIALSATLIGSGALASLRARDKPRCHTDAAWRGAPSLGA
jgi:hypothetical protein